MVNKVCELFFQTPESWLHIREIARKLNISPNSVRKYVAKLKNDNVLEEKKDGNMIKFRARLDSDKYKRKKLLYNLEQIYVSNLVDFLYDFYAPKAIVLFGSYARGEDTSSSDVDIAILTNSKKRPKLTEFEKVMSREIQLSLFTKKDVSDEFFNNIINGIVLKGFLKIE